MLKCKKTVKLPGNLLYGHILLNQQVNAPALGGPAPAHHMPKQILHTYEIH